MQMQSGTEVAHFRRQTHEAVLSRVAWPPGQVMNSLCAPRNGRARLIADTVSDGRFAICNGLLRFANQRRLIPTQSECRARTRSLSLPPRPLAGRRRRALRSGDQKGDVRPDSGLWIGGAGVLDQREGLESLKCILLRNATICKSGIDSALVVAAHSCFALAGARRSRPPVINGEEFATGR